MVVGTQYKGTKKLRNAAESNPIFKENDNCDVFKYLVLKQKSAFMTGLNYLSTSVYSLECLSNDVAFIFIECGWQHPVLMSHNLPLRLPIISLCKYLLRT
jgi:hypothetical protein